MKAILSGSVAIAAMVAIALLASALSDVIGGIVAAVALLAFFRTIMDFAAEPGEDPQRSGRPR